MKVTWLFVDSVATGPHLFHLDGAAAILIGLPRYFVVELGQRYVQIIFLFLIAMILLKSDVITGDLKYFLVLHKLHRLTLRNIIHFH